VGKTTAAISLAAGLAASGLHVLLVDSDPQANATTGLGMRALRGDATSYDLVLDPTAHVEPKATAVHNLDLLPSCTDLAGAEVELVATTDRETRLRTGLGAHANYDVTIIDCPPSLGLLSLNALVAANGVIVPLQCEYLALEGLSQVMRTVHRVRISMNRSLALTGIVMTMYDRRTNLASQVVAEVRKHFPRDVFDTIIPRSIRLGEAPSHGMTIFDYDATSNGAGAFRELTTEIIEREGLTGAHRNC
jgi:chromosome partitioning protein